MDPHVLHSMTGYGSAARSDSERAVTVEVRSVNHRYSDIVPKLPKGYQALEERIRRVAGEFVQRGRVEIFVSIEEYRAKERTVRIDSGLLEGYAWAFREAAALLGAEDTLDVDKLLAFPDVLIVEEREVDVDAAWPMIDEALREALDRLVAMRQAEGERLFADIAHRLRRIEQIIQQMAERAPSVVEEYRRRLWERSKEWLGEFPIDENRLALEVALFADRASIDEELTRARSHISEFLKVCKERGAGRKLDFLLQELQREANTIGSKAHDTHLAAWVVEVKAEIEKIREQVQNIE